MKIMANGLLDSINSTVEFKLIEHGSREYENAVALREEILRRPLGLVFSEQELEAEVNQLHFAGYVGDEIIATAILQCLTHDIVKIRQVAVKEGMQRCGIGCLLLEVVENEALKRDAKSIELHARLKVVNFYINLGYMLIGAPFEEIGIPHQKMQKKLEIS